MKVEALLARCARGCLLPIVEWILHSWGFEGVCADCIEREFIDG